MNKKLENLILGGLLTATLAGFYISLDKATQMTQVNPTNNVTLYFKTAEKTQITKETYTATNTNYKN